MGKFLDALKNIGLKVNGTKPTSTTTVAVLNEIADDFANGTTATKEYVNSLMSGALKRAIVEELPTTDIDTNTIYMVLDTTAASGNVYNEYLYIEEAWELIGTTEVQTNHLYRHHIVGVLDTQFDFACTIINASSTPFTYTDLYNYLSTNGYTNAEDKGLNCTGRYGATTLLYALQCLSSNEEIYAIDFSFNLREFPNTITITDTVVQIF